MEPSELPAVSLACKQRLAQHYGPSIADWLNGAPRLLKKAADRFALRLLGYHDAGHASVLATALDQQGRTLLVKVWPDRDRFEREWRVLRLWYPSPDDLLVAVDPELAAAVLVIVGGIPGGAPRPRGDSALVAAAIHRAHLVGRHNAHELKVPALRDYLHEEVLPRIHRRILITSRPDLAQLVVPYLQNLVEDRSRETVLHADLYRENIPFTAPGEPILLDPLPMRGDPIFDWAFWCVYYDLGHRMDERLSLVQQIPGAPLQQLLAWVLLLSVDGLLFYEETHDPRFELMTRVLAGLLHRTEAPE